MKKLLPGLFLFTLLAIQVWMGQPSSGQSGRIYERFQATPEYLEAVRLLEDPGSRTQGVEKLLALGRAHPGTTLGGKCLFDAAAHGENETLARQIYQEVSRDYAGSVFDLVARQSIMILDRGAQPPTDKYIDDLNNLVHAVGGPTLTEIQRNPAVSLRRIRSLEPSLAEGIGTVYSSEWCSLMALKRFQDARALAIFGREALAYTDQGSDFYNKLQDSMVAIDPTTFKGGNGGPVDVQAKVSIKENQIVCACPKVVIEAHSGDYRQPSIDLQERFSTVTLDGQDIRRSLVLMLKYPKKFKIGHVFEDMTLTYQPSSPLSAGNHTLYIRLQTTDFEESGIGRCEITRHFYVDRHRPDDRDDDDENDRERQRERSDD